MFESFLSRDMTYSCGIFTDLDGDLNDNSNIGAVNGGIGLKRLGNKFEGVNGHSDKLHGVDEKDELEEAQLRKIRSVSASQASGTLELIALAAGISSRRRTSRQVTEYLRLALVGDLSLSRWIDIWTLYIPLF